MAEKPFNGAHPKLRPGKLSTQRKTLAGVQNARKDESLEPVQRNILKAGKKKHNKKNKEKKTGSSGAGIPEEGATVILDPQQKHVLEQNHIILLDKKPAKNLKVLFLCKLCKHRFVNLTAIESHIRDKQHQRMMEEEAERVTLLNLPPPTVEQVKYLDRLLKEEVILHGLSDTDIRSRQYITTTLAKSVAEEMPGCTVRLYGSSASGFGLKKSDVNLELCVPPEMSPPKGLIAAYHIIANQETYSKVEHDFTAKIPAVRFIDRDTNLSCTLTLSNNHSYKIAELLSKYASINERVRTLGVAFRLWAQRCRLDNVEVGMWPPYAFPLLLVYFLQQLRKPVLPVLHELVDATDVENKSDVYLDPNNLEGIWMSENKMSLGELWLELFRFYALDFDIVGRVVCIQQSSPLLQNGSLNKWLTKRLAIRDPFLPKRNVTRSMLSHVSFEYCMKCFRNTYKYYGILRTKIGPIFDIILLDIPEELSSLYKETSTADKVTKNTTDIRPHFSKTGTIIMTVSEVEEKLKKSSIRAHGSGTNIMSVSIQQAREMFSCFNSTYLHYKFDGENFIGNQKYPEICTLCHKEGHRKDQCKEECLPEFDTSLPPMKECYKETLNQLCSHVLAKWAVTPEEVEKRKGIISDIEEYIVQFYPTAKLELFGSSCNGFGLLKSDVDICLTFTDSETGKEHDHVKVIEELQQKLKKFGVLRNLIPITTAKVPILKFYHTHSKLEGDISIYNILGQQNTKLLRTYAEIDPRVKMLGYMMKRFAKVCGMCDASRGSLSSYAYIIMVIYFLQQCSPPVLPVLQELSETHLKPQRIVEDCNTYFYEDLDSLEKLWPDYGKNTSSVGELWIQLLRFYSAEFDFGTYVISIRQTGQLLRFEKMWTSKCMAIEDPFDLSHNLGSGLSRNMHIYIVKSFRKGYMHFGIPPADTALMTENPEEYFFNSEKLTCGNPPNDRGCRICKKIGHLCRDCPQKRQARHRGVAGGGGDGRKRTKTSAVQNLGLMGNFNLMNCCTLTGYNSPFGSLRSPMHGAQFGQGRFRNPGELPPYRGGYNPVLGNSRSQDKFGMRYGVPHASPPFRTCASPMDWSRKIGASGSPSFVELRSGQPLQERYEVACLGFIQDKHFSKDLKHLKPQGEIHHVPKVPSDVVVMNVFPPGRR